MLEGITEQAWIELARELIPAGQPAAENPLDPDLPSGREEGVALVVAEKLRAMDFDVRLAAKTAGRPNVIGVWSGGDGPSLILNDHLDTYPAGDPAAWTMTDGKPYSPTRHGDRLYSRGTSDTRGNLACTLLAVKALRDAGVALKGTLQCVYTVDEEKNGPDGSIYLLDEYGLKGDFEITCEPTGWTKPDGSWGMGIAIANSGNFLVKIETRGTKTHIWRPDTGVNAVAKMARLLAALETMTFGHESPTLYGGTPPMVTVVRIGAGVPGEMQFTPDRCAAVLAVVGIVPGMTQDSVMADINASWRPRRRRTPTCGRPRSLSQRAVRPRHRRAGPGRAAGRCLAPGLPRHPRRGAADLSQERLQRHDPLCRTRHSRHHLRPRRGRLAADQRIYRRSEIRRRDQDPGADDPQHPRRSSGLRRARMTNLALVLRDTLRHRRDDGTALRPRFGISIERLLTVATVAALLAAWFVLTRWHLVNPLFLPAPEAVWDAFVTTATSGYQGSRLDQHVLASLERVLAGWALACVVGIPPAS